MGNKYGDRNIQDKEQHFARFEIKIKLSKLRKAREILQRDGIGIIIHSQPPAVLCSSVTWLFLVSERESSKVVILLFYNRSD